jgi:NAD(P)-dependent dehydrogenase (short-subunit alcohol dehydrogenase family)
MAVFDRLVAVNLKGVVMGCKRTIPHMLARQPRTRMGQRAEFP